MGLVPRIETPSNKTRRLYIVGASFIAAMLAIASLVFDVIFYVNHQDDFDYNTEILIQISFDCLIVAGFFIQAIIFGASNKLAESGGYVLTMMLVVLCCILVNFGTSISVAVKYNKDKEEVTIQELREDWNNISIVSLMLWGIAFIVYIYVIVVYARIYHCG